MKKNILLGVLTLIAFMIGMVEGRAQKVVVLDGYAVIDCSSMPTFYTKEERATHKMGNGQLKRHTSIGSWSIGGTNSVAANTKVSRKFAVSPTDVGKGGDAAGGGMNKLNSSGYRNAVPTELNYFNPSRDKGACYLYQGADNEDLLGTWRLPSQRELMLIWIMYEDLFETEKSGTSNFEAWTANTNYWSASDGDTGLKTWCVNSKTGVTNMVKNASEIPLVRCIKDL